MFNPEEILPLSSLSLNKKTSQTEVKTSLKKQRMLSEYSKLKSEYLGSIFYQDIKKSIRAISFKKQLSYTFRSQPIYMLLCETAKELLMTLIEVSIFSEALNQYLTSATNLAADVYFSFVGFTVKKLFSDDLRCISEYLNKKILNFEEHFGRWEKNSGLILKFSTRQLNFLFNKSRKGNQALSYNDYVDKILQTTPPYQIESREVMKLILSDRVDIRSGLSEKKKQENDGEHSSVYNRIASVFEKLNFNTIEIGSSEGFICKEKDKFLESIAKFV